MLCSTYKLLYVQLEYGMLWYRDITTDDIHDSLLYLFFLLFCKIEVRCDRGKVNTLCFMRCCLFDNHSLIFLYFLIHRYLSLSVMLKYIQLNAQENKTNLKLFKSKFLFKGNALPVREL